MTSKGKVEFGKQDAPNERHMAVLHRMKATDTISRQAPLMDLLRNNW
ncbi:hypothetical protein EVAR_72101_1, partial [Eumeta japonica]